MPKLLLKIMLCDLDLYYALSFRQMHYIRDTTLYFSLGATLNSRSVLQIVSHFNPSSQLCKQRLNAKCDIRVWLNKT